MTRPLPQPDPQDLTKNLVAFLRDEVGKAGYERGVVGVSGGLDSAVTLALAGRALGPEQVLAVLLPHRLSSAASRRDGQAAAQAAGTPHECIDISPLADAYQALDDGLDRLRLGNLIARLRMAVLYDRAARRRALVIGTGNRSEILLGYCTRWGDGAYDLNPLGGLYKSQLYPLAEYLGVPESIRRKPPSADLWPGQTDEGELGFDYATVDRLLFYLEGEGGTPESATAREGFDPDFVSRVVRLVERNRFKRHMPRIASIPLPEPGSDPRSRRDPA
jgi:NAD+ synthase